MMGFTKGPALSHLMRNNKKPLWPDQTRPWEYYWSEILRTVQTQKRNCPYSFQELSRLHQISFILYGLGNLHTVWKFSKLLRNISDRLKTWNWLLTTSGLKAFVDKTIFASFNWFNKTHLMDNIQWLISQAWVLAIGRSGQETIVQGERRWRRNLT